MTSFHLQQGVRNRVFRQSWTDYCPQAVSTLQAGPAPGCGIEFLELLSEVEPEFKPEVKSEDESDPASVATQRPGE